MALTFTQAYDVSRDPAVKKRVIVAVVRVAIAVQAEDETALSIPPGVTLTQQQLHDKRSIVAYSALRDPEHFADLFSYTAASDDSITANTTDAQLQTIIANQWNAFAIGG